MNASTLRQSVRALGERLSRAPRRLAAAVALLSVLAVGGAGTVLAATHPPLAAAIAPGAVRVIHAHRPIDERWERHFHRHGTMFPARPGLDGR